ncbi:MAG: hypothetical protein ACERIH_01460 [Labilibaculum antarcticum]
MIRKRKSLTRKGGFDDTERAIGCTNADISKAEAIFSGSEMSSPEIAS